VRNASWELSTLEGEADREEGRWRPRRPEALQLRTKRSVETLLRDTKDDAGEALLAQKKNARGFFGCGCTRGLLL
jgi:hypothetical protein